MVRRKRSKLRRPSPVDPNAIEALEQAVPIGEYRTLAPSAMPVGIPTAGPNCRAVVVAASTFSGSPIEGLDPAHTPIGSVYLWRAFRTGSSASLPHKVDDALYFRSGDGLAWVFHSKDSPDHHSRIASASGLDGILMSYSLPAASEGTLQSFRESGARLDFEGPFTSRPSS
jgi:hypothetical protein